MEWGDFGLTLSLGSIKRVLKKAHNSHVRNELLELIVEKYLGNKTAFPAKQITAFKAGYSLFIKQHLYFICNGRYIGAD